ncbi:hypothetical protein VT06_16510 [Arsukibacterium sp. MJ3]|uniref:hypothetical protein n=1 Tax=Arsukibacterium sp. MJ3 TaxID=1632859 RepID=UPI0006271782|nr:hypothetical protein [Arsukibacterium sp. MJ3]KKO47542.1 hypothetical protein VT06_16510 [Arsukibacterium sp. MJ3]
MTGKTKSSLLERFLGASLFFVLSVASIVWFILSASSSVSDIISSDPVLNFDKGAMYMLGGSIGAFSLFIGVAYHSIFSRKVPEKVEKTLIRGAIFGVLIMILVPQVTHFGIGRIVHERQYIECHQVEYRWLLYKKYVYTKNQDVCQNLATEISKSSSGR